MDGGTMSCVDHGNGSWSGAVQSQVDLRPVILAIREMSAALGRDIVVQAEAPSVTVQPADAVVSVNVPSQAAPVVTVEAPSIVPIPAPTVTVTLPVMPLMIIGVLSIIAQAVVLAMLVSK